MPKPLNGLHHVALYVKNFTECLHFYTVCLGMKIVWQPDPDNVYLSSGTDNLALHRATHEFAPPESQRLDHLGFIVNTKEDVDDWYQLLKTQNIPLKTTPKDHRDGARSFYCSDPDGNSVQLIYLSFTT